MKKASLLLAAVLLALSLTACGGKSESTLPEYEVEVQRPTQTSVPVSASSSAVQKPEEKQVWLVEPRADIEIVESLADRAGAQQVPGEWHRNLALFKKDDGVGVIDLEGNVIVAPSENVHWCPICGITNSDESKIFNEKGENVGSGGHVAPGARLLYDPDSKALYTSSYGMLSAVSAEQISDFGVLAAEVVTVKPVEGDQQGYAVVDAYGAETGEVLSVSEPRGKIVLKTDGTPLDDVLYEEIKEAHEGAIAAKRDGKWGFLNEETGEQLIPFLYNAVNPYHEGLAAVDTGNGWTYISLTGTQRTSAEFTGAATVQDGKAWVKTDKGWGVIRLEDWPAK